MVKMTIGCKVYVEDNHDLTFRYAIEIKATDIADNFVYRLANEN